MQVETLATEDLGDRSYLVHDGSTAIVVDPQRDLDRLESVIDRLGVRIESVLETHIHNDYVTGGFELARRTGADYLVNAADEVAFERHKVLDGDELRFGTMQVAVIATPGHTDTHLAYVVSDSAEPSAAAAVFTGGSLLYGSVGRTDLVDPGRTVELTRAQYRSARTLADRLPDDTVVFPTHGFGSFCSSGSATGGELSTIGQEKRANDALTTADEQEFVTALVAGLTVYPAYYAHMGALNRAGPPGPDLSAPVEVDADELVRRMAAGEWVVDLRDRVAYAGDHLAGSFGFALGNQFATYLGWLIPWGTPVTLLGTDRDQVADAQRQLVRIGIDRPAGAATGSLDAIGNGHPRRQYPCVRFADLAGELGAGNVILDVRRRDERAAGHIVGSAHVPLDEISDRLDELPSGRLWVHCQSGYRASIGASVLDRAGREVVLIDDDYDNVGSAGLPLG